MASFGRIPWALQAAVGQLQRALSHLQGYALGWGPAEVMEKMS